MKSDFFLKYKYQCQIYVTFLQNIVLYITSMYKQLNCLHFCFQQLNLFILSIFPSQVVYWNCHENIIISMSWYHCIKSEQSTICLSGLFLALLFYFIYYSSSTPLNYVEITTVKTLILIFLPALFVINKTFDFFRYYVLPFNLILNTLRVQNMWLTAIDK